MSWIIDTHAMREPDIHLEKMSGTSSAIVLGRCISNEAVEEPNGLIYTHTTFKLEQVIKGNVDGEYLTIRVPGGQIGDREVSVSGRPEFVETEDVILFLSERNGKGYRTLQSFSEGVYRIGYSAQRDERVIRSAVRNTDEPYSGVTDWQEAVSVDEFIKTIKDFLEN